MGRDLKSAEAFQVLETMVRAKDRVVTRSTGAACAGGEILFAVDHNGRRQVLIPVGSELIAEDRRSVVQLHNVGPLEEGGPNYFSVVCTRSDLASPFDILVEELIDKLDGSQESGRLTHLILKRWRDLFGRTPEMLLGVKQLAGVVGELIVLAALGDAGSSPKSDWWTGPDGHFHDIVSPKGSIEVKSTLKADDSVVTIHGLSQLADSPERTLLLVLVRLALDPSGAITLPGLIAELASRGLDEQVLVSKASSLGADRRDYEAYSQLKFSVRSVMGFVPESHGFPRITSVVDGQPLPGGVSNLRYDIDLNAVPGGSLSENELEARFGRF